MTRETAEGITINVDLDGVVADLHSALIYMSGGPPPFKSDITHWEHPIAKGIWEKLKTPEIYDWMPPIAQAREHVNGLYDSGYKVVIVSNRPPEAFDYTERWLDSFGFKVDGIMLTDDKNKAGPHILIDDKPENVWRYADSVGPAILFSQPWNQNWTIPGTPNPLLRCKGWDETLQRVRNLINVQHLYGVR